MAFTIPCRPNVLQILKELDNDARKHRQITNLTRKMTLGLNSTFQEIRATRSFSNISIRSSSTFPTNEFGHLLIGSSAPVLLKRYRLVQTIAHGTFSQIFRAFDLFHLQHVAIKVMRIGYNALGFKEHEFLQFVATKTLRGAQSCKLPISFSHQFNLTQLTLKPNTPTLLLCALQMRSVWTRLCSRSTSVWCWNFTNPPC